MKKSTMMFGKYIFLFLLVSAIGIASCQKDKVEDPPVATKKELLSNKWTVSDVQDAQGNSLINLPIPQIACLKDNIFTIAANDTYTIDEGAVACNPSSAGSGTWALIEDDTKLKFTPTTGDPLTFTLLDVNTTTLKISYVLADGPLPGTYTIILQKQ